MAMMTGSNELPTECTNEEYHRDKHWKTSSMIRDASRSWRVYEGKHITGTIKSEETPAMRLGTAVHCAVLEGESYATDYVIPPTVDRRTKAGKAEHAEFVAENSGKVFISNDDAMTVAKCSMSLRNHRVFDAALNHELAFKEETICFGGAIPCKCRHDLCIPSLKQVWDVKTIADIDDIEKHVANFGYHVQAAHYIRGAEFEYGDLAEWQFYFAFVETKPPYRCRVIQLDSESLGIGFDIRERVLTDLSRREQENDWSDVNEQEITEVSLPRWYKQENA